MKIMATAAAAVIALGALAACAGPVEAMVSTAAASEAATASPALLGEVRRELGAARSTRYRHKTHVDEGAGRFDYDCSGLLDYALGRVLPDHLAVLPVTTSTRPLAADIERHLRAAPVAGSAGDPWRSVPRIADLVPGDVVAWLATERSDGDTGHVMIVVAAPTPDPRHPGEWLVPVADSTRSPHARDSRDDDDSGLGTGTIGLAGDADGRPVAYRWRGGLSPTAVATEIALGRP